MLAAEQSALAEFRPTDAALRAYRGFGLFHRQAGMIHHKISQQLVDGHVRFGGQTFALGGALLAKMLFDLFTALDLGEMHGRLLAAGFAFHDGL